MTVADAIDVGMGAKAIGASIFVETDGELRRFTFRIDEQERRCQRNRRHRS
jgi:hypothetical protein